MRWHAIKLLEHDEEVMRKSSARSGRSIADHSYEKEIINEKYDYIEEIMEEMPCSTKRKKRRPQTENRPVDDRIRCWGIPIFLWIMALVFFLTFTVGDLSERDISRRLWNGFPGL